MSKANPAKDSPVSFESALAELEAIVQAMERGEAPLEAQLAAYERGAALLRHCQETLAAAEQKVRVLEGGTPREFTVPSEAGRED